MKKNAQEAKESPEAKENDSVEQEGSQFMDFQIEEK
jgi:hypothetical protein